MERAQCHDPEKMLCYCLGVRYGVVEGCIEQGGLKTVSEVTRACRAGGGCRSCHPEIQELLDHARSKRKRGGLLRRLLSWGSRP
jgi:NifU-like protein